MEPKELIDLVRLVPLPLSFWSPGRVPEEVSPERRGEGLRTASLRPGPAADRTIGSGCYQTGGALATVVVVVGAGWFFVQPGTLWP